MHKEPNLVPRPRRLGQPEAVSRSAVLLRPRPGILEERGHAVDTLTLRDLPAEALMHAEFDHPAIIDAAARLEKADGLIVATPVYKAAFSGLLKTWLDLMPQFGLAGKVVLPLATGGSVAHALALDYALRPVLTSMDARHVVNGFLVLDRFIDSPPAGTCPHPRGRRAGAGQDRRWVPRGLRVVKE